jgi:hypothetical protein
MPVRLRILLPLALAAPFGCGHPAAAPPVASPPPRPETGSRFDPATAGTIRGQVLWHGDVPNPSPLAAPLPDGRGNYRPAELPNPFAPAVDGKTRGLAWAVVYLKGIDPERGRPWDLPPVRVEMRDYRIHIRQGDDEARPVGFVRRGDEIEMASADPVHHTLRARGAAYFSLPFPDPGQPLRRRLDTPGLVELTSGAGYYWAAADLFADDHPYYAATDREGRFTLPGVPPGSYELVCRVRNWHTTGKDRDPETGLIARMRWADPAEKRGPVSVETGQVIEHSFTLTSADFPTSADQ